MWKYSLTSLVTILITHNNVTHLCSATVCTITYDQNFIADLTPVTLELYPIFCHFLQQHFWPAVMQPWFSAANCSWTHSRGRGGSCKWRRSPASQDTLFIFHISHSAGIIQGCLYGGYVIMDIAVLGQFCAEVITSNNCICCGSILSLV